MIIILHLEICVIHLTKSTIRFSVGHNIDAKTIPFVLLFCSFLLYYSSSDVESGGDFFTCVGEYVCFFQGQDKEIHQSFSVIRIVLECTAECARQPAPLTVSGNILQPSHPSYCSLVTFFSWSGYDLQWFNDRGFHCSIRLGIFLRRYPMARVFIILYMVNTFENTISASQGTVFWKSWKIYWLAFTGSTTFVGHDCSSDIHTWNASWSSCWKIEGINAIDGCLLYSVQSRNDISCSLVVFGS